VVTTGQKADLPATTMGVINGGLDGEKEFEYRCPEVYVPELFRKVFHFASHQSTKINRIKSICTVLSSTENSSLDDITGRRDKMKSSIVRIITTIMRHSHLHSLAEKTDGGATSKRG
jgi:hypothetical protein